MCIANRRFTIFFIDKSWLILNIKIIININNNYIHKILRTRIYARYKYYFIESMNCLSIAPFNTQFVFIRRWSVVVGGITFLSLQNSSTP